MSQGGHVSLVFEGVSFKVFSLAKKRKLKMGVSLFRNVKLAILRGDSELEGLLSRKKTHATKSVFVLLRTIK